MEKCLNCGKDIVAGEYAQCSDCGSSYCSNCGNIFGEPPLCTKCESDRNSQDADIEMNIDPILLDKDIGNK